MGLPSPGNRVLVAGVGHRCWRDRSLGPVLADRLARRRLPEYVDVEDFSFGAIAMMQRLQDRTGLYRRCVFVAAEERGRRPGRVYAYRWPGQHCDPRLVQRLITEAGAGVVALDPLLVICTHFGVLPREVLVVEVEPAEVSWGECLSPRVEALLPRLERRVLRLAGAAGLAGSAPRPAGPVAPLCGGGDAP